MASVVPNGVALRRGRDTARPVHHNPETDRAMARWRRHCDHIICSYDTNNDDNVIIILPILSILIILQIVTYNTTSNNNWLTLGGAHKFCLHKCHTPAGLGTCSGGWGLPTLGCLCEALPNVGQVPRPTGVWQKGCLELIVFSGNTTLWQEKGWILVWSFLLSLTTRHSGASASTQCPIEM